jgi:hypothetical protein
MQVKQAFALAHWMICCALMLLLSMLSYGLMTTWYRQLTSMHERCDTLLPLHLALDVFKKDVAQASSITDVTEHQCRLVSSHNRIMWRIDGQKLTRSAAHYDAVKRNWKKPSTSLLAQNITDGRFVPIDVTGNEERERPRGIRVTMQQGATTIKQIGYLRNGQYKAKS